ncbi:MAG: hypothetical protein HKN17_05860 [Rhodothermales bacterium]|nr:hypothetical protein [Rhodothermales bacterium]
MRVFNSLDPQQLIVLCLAGLLVLPGCDSGSAPEIRSVPLPDPIDPSNFPAQVDVFNPLFPLRPGLVTRTTGQSAGGEEVVLVEVTDETRTVQGVVTTVVRDRVWVDGELVEDTDDWFAQDADGNVWYFGEDVEDFENGVVISTAGSWESGVDGAMAGIIMHANPRSGSVYRQEYYRGEAEDIGEVIAVGRTIDVPAGTFTDCVLIEDTTPLEPDVRESKYFCPGVGNALTIDHSEGDARFELVEVTFPE